MTQNNTNDIKVSTLGSYMFVYLARLTQATPAVQSTLTDQCRCCWYRQICVKERYARYDEIWHDGSETKPEKIKVFRNQFYEL